MNAACGVIDTMITEVNLLLFNYSSDLTAIPHGYSQAIGFGERERMHTLFPHHP